jgi:cyclic dehypoxanthinyl futalosine synthase
VIYDAALDDLLQKVWDGGRINQQEAVRLYHLPLEELGTLADRRREVAKKDAYDGRGNEIVTYIVDRNINYTNVCNVYCKFCAFYRTEKDDDTNEITLYEINQKTEETSALVGTQILMQGGPHPKLTKQWYLDLLSHLKEKFPGINVHGFSPSEFIHFREVFNEPLEKIISDFKAAGLGSIPGGGGEILVDRVRQRISPLKAMSDDWLLVMDVAHRLGLNSSATMMFGHVETIEERFEHFVKIREVQSRKPENAKGFLAFIPWTFQDVDTLLAKIRGVHNLVTAEEYIRMIAMSRIMLPNIKNIQASWLTVGKQTAQICLHAGANDFGSIMIEENVVSAAGAPHRFTYKTIQDAIREAGFEPQLRNQQYEWRDIPKTIEEQVVNY